LIHFALDFCLKSIKTVIVQRKVSFCASRITSLDFCRESRNEVLYYAVISQEKAEMLKKHFFLEKLQANFSDIKEIIYFSEMKLLSQILAKNI